MKASSPVLAVHSVHILKILTYKVCCKIVLCLMKLSLSHSFSFCKLNVTSQIVKKGLMGLNLRVLVALEEVFLAC